VRITAHRQRLVGACVAILGILGAAGATQADTLDRVVGFFEEPRPEASAKGAVRSDSVAVLLRGNTLIRLHEESDYAADFAAWDGPPLRERIKSALSYHVPVAMGQNKMIFSVRARPKLRRLLELKLRF